MNNIFRYKFKSINKTILIDLEVTLNNLNTSEIKQVSDVLESIMVTVDNMIKEEINGYR